MQLPTYRTTNTREKIVFWLSKAAPPLPCSWSDSLNLQCFQDLVSVSYSRQTTLLSAQVWQALTKYKHMTNCIAMFTILSSSCKDDTRRTTSSGLQFLLALTKMTQDELHCQVYNSFKLLQRWHKTNCIARFTILTGAYRDNHQTGCVGHAGSKEGGGVPSAHAASL